MRFVGWMLMAAATAAIAGEEPFKVSLQNSEVLALSPFEGRAVEQASPPPAGTGVRVTAKETLDMILGQSVSVRPLSLGIAESEILRRNAPNQALQLTADRRDAQFHFYETVSDISKARSRQR